MHKVAKFTILMVNFIVLPVAFNVRIMMNDIKLKALIVVTWGVLNLKIKKYESSGYTRTRID